MNRVNLKSSFLKSVGFDGGARMLEVEFASGEVWQFASVPMAVYAELVRAPSKGTYFEHFISDRYVHKRVL